MIYMLSRFHDLSLTYLYWFILTDHPCIYDIFIYSIYIHGILPFFWRGQESSFQLENLAFQHGDAKGCQWVKHIGIQLSCAKDQGLIIRNLSKKFRWLISFIQKIISCLGFNNSTVSIIQTWAIIQRDLIIRHGFLTKGNW